MQARSLTFAALASGVLLLGTAPAPVTVKYRIKQTSEQEVDLTVAGQGKQHQKSGSSMFVTVTYTDSAAGRTVHFVVDSAVADSGTPDILKAQFDSLRGQAFHAFLAGGKVTGLKALKDGQATAGISTLITVLSPRIKPGTKVGATWSDTTDATNDVPSGNITTRTVANYKASAQEMRGGVKTLKVDVASSSALSGQQSGNTIEGTGTGTATQYVGPDGRLVASTISSMSTLAVTSPQLPEPIPVTIKGSVTVTVIK